MIYFLKKVYLGHSQVKSPKNSKGLKDQSKEKNCLEQNIFPGAGQRSPNGLLILSNCLQFKYDHVTAQKNTVIGMIPSFSVFLFNWPQNLYGSLS